MNMTPRGLQRLDAATYVGCGMSKFNELVETGHMPKPRKIGNRNIWDRSELDEFFENLPRRNAENDNDWD